MNEKDNNIRYFGCSDLTSTTTTATIKRPLTNHMFGVFDYTMQLDAYLASEGSGSEIEF
jgi:hypothetical protein